MRHAYAQELATYLNECWDRKLAEEYAEKTQLPQQHILEKLISACYQAGLLTEEATPVRFRLILGEPECFSTEDRSPTALHRLVFSKPLAFNEYELQHLSPAADFYRSLIGVRLDPQTGLQIWGIVHSGTRWLQNIYGGRLEGTPLPPALVVCVTDPGRITVCMGAKTIATLNRGRISTPSREVFESAWLPKCFDSVRSVFLEAHKEARSLALKPWAALDSSLVETLTQHVVRRIIGSVRSSPHGGTIFVIPPEMAQEVLEENRYMTVKYKVTDKETRKRFQNLMVSVMNALAEVYESEACTGKTVGWDEYVHSDKELLSNLDEAIFNMAHLFADLTSVDGAVILTKSFELLGFGAEISSELERVRTVARALDIEGMETEPVDANNFGMRHRAAYRLCNALHEVIGLVVSQDKLVRIVKWKNGMVTYWKHVSTSTLDL